MTTSASTPHMVNEVSNQTRRVSIRCSITNRKLGVVSSTGEWPTDLRQWMWCRSCHQEHLIEKQQVEEARERDAKIAESYP